MLCLPALLTSNRKNFFLNSFLENYQKQTMSGLWIKPGIDPIVHCALKLNGEVGEVAEMVGKQQYDPPKLYDKIDLIFELGDVFWYTSNLAALHGQSIEDVMIANIAKLANRHPTRGVYDVGAL